MKQAVRGVEAQICQNDHLGHLEPDRLADDSILEGCGHKPVAKHAHADDDHHHAQENKDPVDKDIEQIVPPPFAEHVLLLMQRQQALERDKDQGHQQPSAQIEKFSRVWRSVIVLFLLYSFNEGYDARGCGYSVGKRFSRLENRRESPALLYAKICHMAIGRWYRARFTRGQESGGGESSIEGIVPSFAVQAQSARAMGRVRHGPRRAETATSTARGSARSGWRPAPAA